MAKKPLFSVVIPTYNCAEKLRRALKSIEEQSFKDFEVIVCDDGSCDHTKDVIDAFSDKFDIKYLWQEHWGGPARARNNGIRIARGDYIAFLDADDRWYPLKLEIVKRHLDNADILYHDLDIYTPAGKFFFKKVKGRHLKKPVFVDLLKNENALITSSVVVKKSILKQVGSFTEGFLNCVEDFDLWLKIARATEKFTYIPKSLGAYWIDCRNISEPSEKIIMRMNFVYNKYIFFLEKDAKIQAQMLHAYLIGRIKQRMGLVGEALKFFKMSVKSKNMKIRIRSIIWIIFLSVFYRFIKNNPR